MFQVRAVLATFLLTTILGGCAFVDESITLQPTSKVSSGTVGHGQKVGLSVVDERATTVLGYRGPMRTAEIKTVQDVRQLVDDAVRQGLLNQDFKPVAYTEAEPATLIVQIRDLSYETSAGLFTGGIHTKAALKVIARRNQQSFEELYRTEEEDRVVIIPTESSDAERINLALSHCIDKMLVDRRLLEFLAETPN
jgi:uncharacterized lipoprotein YajG